MCFRLKTGSFPPRWCVPSTRKFNPSKVQTFENSIQSGNFWKCFHVEAKMKARTFVFFFFFFFWAQVKSPERDKNNWKLLRTPKCGPEFVRYSWNWRYIAWLYSSLIFVTRKSLYFLPFLFFVCFTEPLVCFDFFSSSSSSDFLFLPVVVPPLSLKCKKKKERWTSESYY